MWNAISFAAIALLCVLCAAISLFSARRAFRVSASLVRKQSSIESKLQSMATSHENWEGLVTELVKSVKMAKVRRGISVSGSQNGEPDAKVDPEAWRAWKNAQLRAGQYNQ